MIHIRCSRHSMMPAKLSAVFIGAAGLALAGCGTHAHNSPAPGIPAGPTSSAQPVDRPPSSSTPPVRPASFDLGYQPLYPFATLADAQAWQGSHRRGGHQPWHLDAGQTALSFTRGYLGFTEIDRVMSSRFDADGAHIGVGDLLPENHPLTAAVLHLVRFGNDPDSPWEVVGSDDTTFSLDTPAYGSVVTSPVSVGGHVSTVEPAIHVWVRQLSSEAPLGARCCIPAEAGLNMPWSATVAFTGATEHVLTIAASEGGMAQGVERFAVQGVRT